MTNSLLSNSFCARRRCPPNCSTASPAAPANWCEGAGAALGQGGLDAFLQEYELSSREGVVLMCLAEALLRMPDADTADRLIRDKIGRRRLGAAPRRSESLFVNASTWALMLTGRRAAAARTPAGADLGGILRPAGGAQRRAGDPPGGDARRCASWAGSSSWAAPSSEALERGRGEETRGYRYSFDMLGEAARTDARCRALSSRLPRTRSAPSARRQPGAGPIDGPGISVKLSALHPRYEFAQRDRVLRELVPRRRGAGAGWRRRPTSASPSMPRRPSGSICRST